MAGWYVGNAGQFREKRESLTTHHRLNKTYQRNGEFEVANPPQKGSKLNSLNLEHEAATKRWCFAHGSFFLSR